MLPQILLILGLILALSGFANPLFALSGIPLMITGGIFWRQIYNRGNILYWEWMRLNEQWKIVMEKRETILARIANMIEKYSKYEGDLLKTLSADRSAANFLMQSFPEIVTMSHMNGLYGQIVAIEREINGLRQAASMWNKEVQQMGTDAWFNKCLPSYLRARLNPVLNSPEGDLSVPPDPGIPDIVPRQW